jgi:hypothetical protein
MRVFENRVLRGVFGRKRDEVTRCWRTLDAEEPAPDIRATKSR